MTAKDVGISSMINESKDVRCEGYILPAADVTAITKNIDEKVCDPDVIIIAAGTNDLANNNRRNLISSLKCSLPFSA